MANRIITFEQDPIQERLQDNPLEVFLDIDMKAKLNNDKFAVSRLANVNAIRNSLHNIFTWIPGERVLLPEFGTNLRKLLYEGITDYNIELIMSEIKGVVMKWEPRIQITSILDASTIDDHENNTVHIKIVYIIPGLSDALFEYEYIQKTNTII